METLGKYCVPSKTSISTARLIVQRTWCAGNWVQITDTVVPTSGGCTGYSYTTSVGACRTADGGNAGLTYHSDTNCRERCDNDIECTGFITSDSWCETHYIVSVSGDGREQYTCNSKIEGDTETAAEAEDVADETGEEGYADEVVEDTAEDDMGEDGANEENEAQQNFTYTTSVGACRTADGGEAGLILHSDTNCRERCDNDIECTGFVTSDSWCETHYIVSVSGDGREEFTCNSKIEGGDATEETGDDEGKTDDEDSLEFAFLKPIVRCITDKTRVFEAACTVRMTVRFSVFRPLNYSMIRKKTFDSAEICELSEDGYRATLNCKPARLQKKKQRLYLKLTGISETKRYVAVVRMNGKQYMSGVAELTV